MNVLSTLFSITRYIVIALIALLLVGCSGLGGITLPGSNANATPTESQLAKLRWCSKQSMVFRDEGVVGTPSATATPTTISTWSQFRNSLGFTVYLPATLPGGACLMSASGTVHDPIFGSNFTIGFLLPGDDAVSLSEAPVRSQNPIFQCSPAPATGGAKASTPTVTAKTGQATLQLCTGARDKTNIVFSARGTTNDLQNFFQNLQPDVNWVPAS